MTETLTTTGKSYQVSIEFEGHGNLASQWVELLLAHLAHEQVAFDSTALAEAARDWYLQQCQDARGAGIELPELVRFNIVLFSEPHCTGIKLALIDVAVGRIHRL